MAKPAVAEKAVAKGVKLRLVGTIGSMTDELFELRERKRELAAQIDEIEHQYKTIEDSLVAKLDAEGTAKGGGSRATVSLSTSVVCNIVDWDVAIAYLVKSKNTHIFRKQLNDASWRELYERKGAVPGTEPFSKRRLSVTAI